MNTHQDTERNEQDPLGLRDLPMLEPRQDGWPAVARALDEHRRPNLPARRLAWVATAAGLVLALGLVLRYSPNMPEAEGPVERAGQQAATGATDQPLDSLIAMSQTLERQLRGLRQDAGSMPASTAVYVAELEDLVAQVDNELSFSPDSVNLWGQRVNLLLDLAQIYQHQWERDYGRMASL